MIWCSGVICISRSVSLHSPGLSCCSLTLVFLPPCNIPSLSSPLPPPRLHTAPSSPPRPSIPLASEGYGDAKRITTTHPLNTPGLLRPVQDRVTSEIGSITSGANRAPIEMHHIIDRISVDCRPGSKPKISLSELPK